MKKNATAVSRASQRKNQPKSESIDPSKPLPSVRHEKFAQEAAFGRTDVEAYRLAGYKGQPAYKRACEIRVMPGIEERIAVLREVNSRKSQLSKDRAMQLCAELAEGEHGAEPHHRIAAMDKVGKWCGWEKGTEAEQKAAAAIGGIADMMARIRSGGRL
jgi:hypothetical protein